jgi:hypothetical protein
MSSEPMERHVMRKTITVKREQYVSVSKKLQEEGE